MVTETEARESLCTNAVVECGSGTQKQNLPNELWLSVPVTAPGPGVLVCNSDTANRRNDPHMRGGDAIPDHPAAGQRLAMKREAPIHTHEHHAEHKMCPSVFAIYAAFSSTFDAFPACVDNL